MPAEVDHIYYQGRVSVRMDLMEGHTVCTVLRNQDSQKHLYCLGCVDSDSWLTH